jgi:hypothetical protein
MSAQKKKVANQQKFSFNSSLATDLLQHEIAWELFPFFWFGFMHNLYVHVSSTY